MQSNSALLRAKLCGEVPQDDYEQARAQYEAEIAGIEKELHAAQSTGMTLAGFLRFVELCLCDIAGLGRWPKRSNVNRFKLFSSKKVGL